MRLRTDATVAGLAAVAVALAIYGSSSGAASARTANTSGPFVVGFMNALSGPVSLPGTMDPIELAAKQINAQGGILGRKVVVKGYDTNITASGALSATRLALSQGVDALVGYEIDAGLTASFPLIRQMDVPVLTLGEGPTTSQGALDSDLAWSIAVQSDEEAYISAVYFRTVLHGTTVGLSNSEDANPVEGNQYVQQYAQQQGIHNFVHEQYPESVTDLTAQVLGLKNASVDEQWGYPQNDALLIRQMYQNGEGNIPVMLSTAGAYEWGTHAIPQNETAHVTYVSSCTGLYDSKNQTAQSFEQKLHASYPKIPVASAETYQPDSYDALFILRQAIEEAHSFATPDVTAKLKTLTYNGVCGTYHANSTGAMLNQLSVVSLANYQPKILKVYSNLPSSYKGLR
jgi:branched-chain amino acid transport system substrate-binding protein